MLAVLRKFINLNVVNGFSLMAIQGANALFPLLVFPFLLGVLGTDAFSTLVVAEAVAFYVLTICLYSFDTSGVQYILEAKKNGGGRAEAGCFFNILGVRVFLFLISALPLCVIYYFYMEEGFAVFLVWLFFALGMVLQSNYYFQAIESNWLLAVVVVISRFFAVLAIYLFVENSADLLLASLILVGSFLVSGGAAFFSLIQKFGFSELKAVNFKSIFYLLSEGKHIFVGNASVALFRGANVLILAGVSNASAVSSYSLAEKIIKSIQALARPLNQLFMPKAVKAWSMLAHDKKTKLEAFGIIWKNTRVQIALMLLVLPISVVSIYVAHDFKYLPGFTDYSIFLIALMAPAVIFGVANAMFGAVGLSLIGAQTYFAAAVFSVGVTMFLFSLVASYLLGASGAAIAFVMGEALLLISFVWKFQWNSGRG